MMQHANGQSSKPTRHSSNELGLRSCDDLCTGSSIAEDLDKTDRYGSRVPLATPNLATPASRRSKEF